MRKRVGTSKHQPRLSIGIDASLTHTGVVILDHDGKIIDARTFKSKFKKVHRLVDVREQLMGMIKDQFRPDLANVVIEGYAFGFGKFGHSHSHSIGEMGGVLKTAVVEYGLPVYNVAPASLKKHATGSGKGDKNVIMLKVYRKYKIELADEHQCDAMVLACIGQQIRAIVAGQSPEMPDYEREVVNVVMKGPLNCDKNGD